MRTIHRHLLSLSLGLLLTAVGVSDCSASRQGAVPAATPSTINLPVLPDSAPWAKEINGFADQDRKAAPPTDAALFIGSSSIRLWETLSRDISEIPVINRGFGGSQIADSTLYVDRIVLPYKPRLIVMYAGTNDVASGKSAQQVADDFQAFVTKVRAGLPDVTIAYISINPSISRISQRDRVVEANRLIAAYALSQPNLVFINSYTPMLGLDGLPQKALLRDDGLHLNSDGYKRWTEIVKPTILSLYKYAKPSPQ